MPLVLPSPRRQACLPCRPVEFKNAGYTALNTTVCTDPGAPVGSDGVCAHGPRACLPSLPFGTATGLCGKDTIFTPTHGLLIVSSSQLLPTADARAGYTETSVETGSQSLGGLNLGLRGRRPSCLGAALGRRRGCSKDLRATMVACSGRSLHGGMATQPTIRRRGGAEG